MKHLTRIESVPAQTAEIHWHERAADIMAEIDAKIPKELRKTIVGVYPVANGGWEWALLWRGQVHIFERHSVLKVTWSA